MVNTYERRTRCLGAALDLAQQRRFRKVFRELTPDVVHINQQVAEDGLDLVLAARGCGAAAVSTIHITRSAAKLGARFGKLRDLVTTAILRQANMAHITVAECGRQDLIHRFDLDSQQVRVVPNGVLLAEPSRETRERTRSRWGTRPRQVVIGSVGRLEAQKGPIFALQLIAALRKKGLDIRYVWIGDGALRTGFNETARQLDIAEAVHVDGWRDDVPDCLLGLDIFLMPSQFEGMPLALLEAMGVGLCCCATNVDGIAEAIEHRRSGFLCAPGDLDAWSAQLELLVSDQDTREAVGRQARDHTRMRFGIETMAAETSEVYQDVLRAHRGN